MWKTEILSNPTFSLGSSHRRWCSGRRAAELSATHSLEAPAGGDTSRAPMGSSAATPLARPARNPRGLTPRSPGVASRASPRPFPPTRFPEPQPRARDPAAASTVLTTRAAARLAHLASTAPGRHRRGRRPRGRCPLGPPLGPSRLSRRASERAHGSGSGLLAASEPSSPS